MPTGRMLVRLAGVSILSGVLLGIAARLVMRVIALEAGLAGSFSIGGSLEVAIFGAMVGAPVAFAFLLIRRRVPVSPPWAGLLCGLLLFLALVVLPPPSARSALAGTPDTPLATALAFAALFAVWGGVLDAFSSRVLPASPPRTAHGKG